MQTAEKNVKEDAFHLFYANLSNSSRDVMHRSRRRKIKIATETGRRETEFRRKPEKSLSDEYKPQAKCKLAAWVSLTDSWQSLGNRSNPPIQLSTRDGQ